MDRTRVRSLLSSAGAIIEGHFVGTNGNHLSVYVAKDRATRLTSVASELCSGIAQLFMKENVEVVVAPAIGGIPLSQWTAHHLTQLGFVDHPEVLSLYSEPDDEPLAQVQAETLRLDDGQKVILRRPGFVLKRGFADDVRGKRVLVVEDILTTGGSARQTVHTVTKAGGLVVGLGVLANGGNVTAEECGVKILKALMGVDRQIFTEQDCATYGLCAKGVPVNTVFGHGKAFLARTAGQS